MNIETNEGLHLYIGILTRDPDFQVVGQKNTHKCQLDIALVRANRDLPSEYVNHIVLWRRWADMAQTFRKGDYVIVVGHYEEREWNGKILRDFAADFAFSPDTLLQLMGIKPSTSGTVSGNVQTLGDQLGGGTSGSRSLPKDIVEYEEIEEDLPF